MLIISVLFRVCIKLTLSRENLWFLASSRPGVLIHMQKDAQIFVRESENFGAECKVQVLIFFLSFIFFFGYSMVVILQSLLIYRIFACIFIGYEKE